MAAVTSCENTLYRIGLNVDIKKAVRCSVDMPMTVSTHMSLTYTNVYPQVDL